MREGGFPIRIADLDGLHQGLDGWFYGVGIAASRFRRPPLANIGEGLRSVHLIWVDQDGATPGLAYRKWDQVWHGQTRFDGARDKIAADLGQVLGVSVPPTLLWRDGEDVGAVQKEPPNFKHNLELFVLACEVDPVGAEAEIAHLADAYDPMNVYFDVWICNRDRHINYKNTLVAETSTAIVVWIIDFNASLGHAGRPWTDAHREEHGIEEHEPPVPHIIAKRPDWLQKVKEFAEHAESRLSALGHDSIKEICRRSFEFYKVEGTSEIAAELADRLQCRKLRVREWTWKLLSI